MYKININKLQISTNNKTLLDISSLVINSSTALIGESGSGKSLTLKSLLNLLPTSLKIEKDIDANFNLDYENIGFIPQNPFTSLSPMTKIKEQFFCSLEKKKSVLKLVDLDETVLDKFPNQLSGGQIQRVVIAISLSKDIKLLLLDEPTTALDKENRENIIDLIKNLKDKLNILIIFVSHDIESIKDLCDYFIIIKDGIVIEQASSFEIFNIPKSDYTKSLINSTFKNKPFRK